jgi:hypothetical protein
MGAETAVVVPLIITRIIIRMLKSTKEKKSDIRSHSSELKKSVMKI